MIIPSGLPSIRNVAKKEEVACWDLFTTTGGKTRAANGIVLASDGRGSDSLTKEGYQEQGTLLFRRSWNHIITDKNLIWNIIYLEIGLAIINSRETIPSFLPSAHSHHSFPPHSHSSHSSPIRHPLSRYASIISSISIS